MRVRIKKKKHNKEREVDRLRERLVMIRVMMVVGKVGIIKEVTETVIKKKADFARQ